MFSVSFLWLLCLGDTMDPTEDFTFDLLDNFLGEMASLFPPPVCCSVVRA